MHELINLWIDAREPAPRILENPAFNKGVGDLVTNGREEEKTCQGAGKAHAVELTVSGRVWASSSSATATAFSCSGDNRLAKCSRTPRRCSGSTRSTRFLPALGRIAPGPPRSVLPWPRLTRPAPASPSPTPGNPPG